VRTDLEDESLKLYVSQSLDMQKTEAAGLKGYQSIKLTSFYVVGRLHAI
jgi:hypothetical protein